jgi:hypothetical protein
MAELGGRQVGVIGLKELDGLRPWRHRQPGLYDVKPAMLFGGATQSVCEVSAEVAAL